MPLRSLSMSSPVAERIENATIGVSGRATNISDGLGLALKRMADSDAASKVVILLSDGANNAGATDPLGRGAACTAVRYSCAHDRARTQGSFVV